MLLLDGGTGSELQRRGADVLKEAEDRLKAWSATANIEYADVVQQVHSDYLRVGADIIISNNFWTTPTRLERIGERDNWRKYATAAIRNAVQARDATNTGAYVAGGIAAPSLQERLPPAHSPVSDTRQMGVEAYRKEWADHAKLLADEGADVMLPEYVGFIEDCVVAVDGCAEAGLPVFLGVRHIMDDGTMNYGESLADLALALEGHPVDAVLIMCSNPENISKGLPILRGGVRGSRRRVSEPWLQSNGPHCERADADEPEAERGRGHPSKRGVLSHSRGGSFAAEWKGMGGADHRGMLRLGPGACLGDAACSEGVLGS